MTFVKVAPDNWQFTLDAQLNKTLGYAFSFKKRIYYSLFEKTSKKTSTVTKISLEAIFFQIQKQEIALSQLKPITSFV